MLDRKEDKLFFATDSISEAVVLVDDCGCILQISPGFRALSGWTEQELIGQSLGGLISESRIAETDGSPAVAASLVSVAYVAAEVHRYRRRDGRYFFGETSTLTMRSDDGCVQRRLHIINDVSNRIQQADDLIDLVAFAAEHGGYDNVDLSRFLGLGCRYFGCDVGVFCIADKDRDRLKAIGGNLARSLSEQRLTGYRVSSLLNGNDQIISLDDVGMPSGGGARIDLDVRLISAVQGVERCHGILYFASRRVVPPPPFDDGASHVLRFMAQWLSAFEETWTTRRSYEEDKSRLAQCEKRFRSLHEKTPVIFHSIDPLGRLVSVSDAWLAMMGYLREEVIGRLSTDFLTPHSKQYAEDVVFPAFLATGGCHDIAYQFVTKDGDIRDIELSAISESDDDGNFFRSLAILNDVTERKRVERALIGKTNALKRSNDDLKQIAQIASHDLQEPLRRVITYSDILKEDFGSELSEGAAEVAGVIQSGGRRLRLMINDLVAYVDIREQLDCAFEPVDLAAVICHSLDDLSDEIASREMRIDVAHLPLVWGRAPLLKMVFDHLLSNAIKFGCEHEQAIDVAVDDAGDVWQFAVTDKGKGVEARFADRIFKVFQRLQNRDEIEGSGAGLAICRLIIQRCGGDIWLDRSYGDGARFLFTLPKDKPDSISLGARPQREISHESMSTC